MKKEIVQYIMTEKRLFFRTILGLVLAGMMLAVFIMPSYADVMDKLNERAGEAGIMDMTVDDINIGPLMLPSDSSDMSEILALQLLGMGSVQNAPDTAKLFEKSGFDILDQRNYDKDLQDSSHTCAYTIGKGKVFSGLTVKEAVLVSIRGTSAGEWYSNFDFCPSRSDSAYAAENFMCCAADVFLDLINYIHEDDKDSEVKPETNGTEDMPIIVVCGHSRGGACANLLGLLLNEYVDPSQVYVYTFASPNTIKPDSVWTYDANIFNFINPCDIIPCLPLRSWGFERAGEDVVLSLKSAASDEDLIDKEERYIEILSEISPSVSSYYFDRHSIEDEGLSENGITSFETMLLVCSKVLDAAEKYNSEVETGNELDDDLPGHVDALFEMLSDESDLKGLAEIYNEISEDDFEIGIEILMQHLPTAYLNLMRQ